MEMTRRQSWAIFCTAKVDVREVALTKEAASEALDALNSGDDVLVSAAREELIALGGVDKANGKPVNGTRKLASRGPDYAAIMAEAHIAGMKAGGEAHPAPVAWAQHANPLDAQSPVERAWVVDDGVCGFAWVYLPKGNTAFARYLRERDKEAQARGDWTVTRKRYGGGYTVVHVSQFNQSLQRKEAYARAYAQVLTAHGIDAHIDSRMD